MTDNLRQLDAEFAEKVLGWTDVRLMDYIQVEPDDTGRDWVGVGLDGTQPIPFFCQSLDATWSGVEKLNAIFVTFTRLSPRAAGWGCDLEIQEAPVRLIGAEGQTPAEALVRACLEAVKVER